MAAAQIENLGLLRGTALARGTAHKEEASKASPRALKPGPYPHHTTAGHPCIEYNRGSPVHCAHPRPSSTPPHGVVPVWLLCAACCGSRRRQRRRVARRGARRAARPAGVNTCGRRRRASMASTMADLEGAPINLSGIRCGCCGRGACGAQRCTRAPLPCRVAAPERASAARARHAATRRATSCWTRWTRCAAQRPAGAALDAGPLHRCAPRSALQAHARAAAAGLRAGARPQGAGHRPRAVRAAHAAAADVCAEGACVRCEAQARSLSLG
jgi:hypothetical protein